MLHTTTAALHSDPSQWLAKAVDTRLAHQAQSLRADLDLWRERVWSKRSQWDKAGRKGDIWKLSKPLLRPRQKFSVMAIEEEGKLLTNPEEVVQSVSRQVKAIQGVPARPLPQIWLDAVSRLPEPTPAQRATLTNADGLDPDVHGLAAWDLAYRLAYVLAQLVR